MTRNEDCSADRRHAADSLSDNLAAADLTERLSASIRVGMHYSVMLCRLGEVERIAGDCREAEALADVVSGARLLTRRIAALRRSARATIAALG